MSKRGEKNAEKKPWKLLLWTAVAGLIFGLLQLGEPLEDTLRSARNSVHMHRASGDVVLIFIDNKSLREVGNWPWPRRVDAELVDKLNAAGAKQIFFDINFGFTTNPTDDAALAKSFERAKSVTLPIWSRVGTQQGTKIDLRPLPQYARYTHLASLGMHYNFQNAVWQLPYSTLIDHRAIPSFASAIAGVESGPSNSFRVDYSVDPKSIPTYSAADIMSDPALRAKVQGKQVLIGIGTDVIGDQYYIPGYGRGFGVQVHALGAETLRQGRPIDLGWFGAFLFALAAAGIGAWCKQAGQRLATIGAATGALVVAPTFLEAHLIFADVTPGLFVLLVVGGVFAWRRYRQRGMVDPVSNLPNLNALKTNSAARHRALIAARVLNYEEIVATLPAEGERQLVEQIASRLKVGAPNRILYQGDAGIFAWLEEPQAPFGHHLEAMSSLFRNPARVTGLALDLAVSFGVEIGSSRSIANRLASALVAADEAAHDGLKWKYHDPETLEDASWKLSMLSQLDEAIDRGEVWVAYQPKLELRTGRIVGAEALARWTHPEKGPIAASEFVAAAEQHDRIGKLTDFVLDKAVAAAAQINKRGVEFDIAVNLSARLLNDKGFTLRLSAALARHGLASRHLTLELTETAAMTGSGEGLEMVARLRDLGVNIAIDDYGTGLSTLDYLKKIPANEIKIDQSFVKGMLDNRSDRVMVQSTIGLAHSLGRKVVAEGVESRDILDLLVGMNCDIAQGYAIGRPMSLETLAKRISSERRRDVA